ncbi:uncharacterized oxidoreductase YjmC-like [Ruditapes philippinarum]|uniref:uncharacterized oxidoreductase YjmC-like n=1 Tax=Ruditapes philippinarum TaxID=129788 RepID=UPI00295B9045|nr:uncharacterized oxidoreductase YjmC-like [Ruditapes philippinarum]
MTTVTGYVVPVEEFRDFVVRCSKSVGIAEDHADSLAEMVVSADYRGHYSHGLKNLERYLICVRKGIISGSGIPEVVKQTAATALVDGHKLLGPVVGNFCMDLAMEKAKAAGVGIVSVRGSNHFGMAALYGLRALKHGMIGIALTNTSPGMAPTRGKENVLGTNPICVAAPGTDGDSFLLDMATSAVAYGKAINAKRIGVPIPEGWAVDKDGQNITDPNFVYGMLPLGGVESTSGYKGYGLAMMVEIFCGILSGSNYGHHIISVSDQINKEANLGQCFIAINPDAFEDGFSERMSELLNYCRDLEPVEGENEVLVAGDPERKHMEKCDKQGGILYHPEQMKQANSIAASCNVEPMKILKTI